MKRLLSALVILVCSLSAPKPLLGASADVVDNIALELARPGDHTLHVITPTLLELVLINTKASSTAPVDSWNFVDANWVLTAPATTAFLVTVSGQSVGVQTVGFKRRAMYAPLAVRDLRIDNRLYLQLASPVAPGNEVIVTNPDGNLWNTTTEFKMVAEPLRYSPAIHVNQEGYAPLLSKKAMVGYYIGSLGEMDIPQNGSAAPAYSLVNVATGEAVFSGNLVRRLDSGYTYTPAPYQKVWEADFSAFSTPGEYYLSVAGMGASLSFMIDDGVPINFARAYALGLYNQRCGRDCALPFSRHVHGACHTAAADVPVPQSAFAATWSNIGSDNGGSNANPRQTAPRLLSEGTQLYPMLRTGKIDVSGGHHDAGDYSKYTTNSAQLVHSLLFSVDAFPGVAALDNLGLPESGDGIGDLLQEAKHEADFLAKMQDLDGGFFFLVYPKDRKYEDNVTPDKGDPQIVYPKNTAATAAAVGALAEMSSSPAFKLAYPAEAAAYMQKAQLGWNFLMNAIAAYGKDGSYQRITHYGDSFMHDDELAWAAAAMYAATGESTYEQKLIAWYDPSSSATRRWSWWRLFEGYGCAARTYAFAARTGRLAPAQLNAAYLAKCNAEIIACGNDVRDWTVTTAYGTAFDWNTKRFRTSGWYFSSDRAFDMTVAFQLNADASYLPAVLTNLNYEGGCNPVNASYITGLGYKQQRDIVDQYAQNDRRVLPPSGLPQGNISPGFQWLSNYGYELGNVTFPSDGIATAPFPFYDRWADSFNTANEFVITNQGRSLASIAFLASMTAHKDQVWQSAPAQLTGPAGYVPVGTPITVNLLVPGLDLAGAVIVWEALGQEPAFDGPSHTFTPGTVGNFWVEAEAHWPDGRRVCAATSVSTHAYPGGDEFALDSLTTALYHFNGNFQDSSSNAFHLTPTGNVTLTSDNSGWMGSPSGQVARFAGLNDALTASIPDSKIWPGSTPTATTLEALIYVRSFKGYSFANAPLVSLYQAWDSTFEFKDLKWITSGAPFLMAGNNTVVTYAQRSAAVSLNAWHKLKATISSTGLTQCYIDDVLISSVSLNYPAINFGRTNNWTLTLGNFDGDLDEVRISKAVR